MEHFFPGDYSSNPRIDFAQGVRAVREPCSVAKPAAAEGLSLARRRLLARFSSKAFFDLSKMDFSVVPQVTSVNFRPAPSCGLDACHALDLPDGIFANHKGVGSSADEAP
jgi:hypothetical protein